MGGYWKDRNQIINCLGCLAGCCPLILRVKALAVGAYIWINILLPVGHLREGSIFFYINFTIQQREKKSRMKTGENQWCGNDLCNIINIQNSGLSSLRNSQVGVFITPSFSCASFVQFRSPPEAKEISLSGLNAPASDGNVKIVTFAKYEIFSFLLCFLSRIEDDQSLLCELWAFIFPQFLNALSKPLLTCRLYQCDYFCSQ